jgi:SNF2 family DNA or RNA helicase
MPLYDFQQEDVDKLVDVNNALIMNEMGTGKTYEAIELDRIRREQTPHYKPKTLVVCPLSVTGSWEDHFTELTDLRVRRIDPKNRMAFLKDMDDADVFLLHWEAVRLMPSLQDTMWTHIIADECHKAKNRKAQQTKALKKLKSQYRTAMSGTPMVNRPDELWSILNWLYPQFFTSYWAFFKKYVTTVEIELPDGRKVHKVTGPKNEERLQDLMSDFSTRRLKKLVLKDLPDKYYSKRWVDLSPTQRRMYNEMKSDMLSWIGEHESEPLAAPVVIAQLIRLQQMALATPTRVEGSITLDDPSTKLDALMDIIDELSGEPVVVFTQFKQMAALVEKRLTKNKIAYGMLTGDVSPQEREQNVRDFQSGKTQVFVGTIAAGGVGITLTAASTVVFLDRSWSPALNVQAEDRLHRIGQKEAVQVIDIMARNTVDMGRHQRLEQKWDWIRRVLGDDKH